MSVQHHPTKSPARGSYCFLSCRFCSYAVHVVVDGVSSQRPLDRAVALQRMQQVNASPIFYFRSTYDIVLLIASTKALTAVPLVGASFFYCYESF